MTQLLCRTIYDASTRFYHLVFFPLTTLYFALHVIYYIYYDAAIMLYDIQRIYYAGASKGAPRISVPFWNFNILELQGGTAYLRSPLFFL